MLKRAKRFLTARTTVLVLILLVAASLAAAVIVPQDSAGPAAPRPALVALLGLGHVFATRWFATLSVVFGCSLLLSSWDQLKVSRARMAVLPPEGGETGERCALGRPEVEALLRREGFRRLAGAPGRSRHVKRWQGYWGNSLLHLGMTLSVVCALLYVLTEHRVVVRAVSGAPVAMAPGSYLERRGILAGPLPLPATLTLFRLEPEFWENDRLKELGSELILVDERGDAQELLVRVSDAQRYRGLLVYQQPAFGNAFQVEFRNGPRGDFDMRLDLPFPPRRDQAGYGSYPLAEGGLRLAAKYYAAADRSRMAPDDPQLVLRLYDGDRVVGEAALLAGQAGRLGPYDVRFAFVSWWTDILFEGSLGTVGIFTGFALLMCGGALTFFAVPREAVVRDGAAGCTVSFRSTRFPELYREERARILARCKGEVAA